MMRLLLKGGSLDHDTCVHCKCHKERGDLSPEKARAFLKVHALGSLSACPHCAPLLKAGGEGSRGGHVIGHTKSGKPVYSGRAEHNRGSVAFHVAHQGWSAEDHKEAAALHEHRLAGIPAGSSEATGSTYAAKLHHVAAGSKGGRAGGMDTTPSWARPLTPDQREALKRVEVPDTTETPEERQKLDAEIARSRTEAAQAKIAHASREREWER